MISCSLHTTHEGLRYEELLQRAKTAWKDGKSRAEVDKEFSEVVSYTRIESDLKRRSQAHHEWGRYLLTVNDLIESEKQFMLSLALLEKNDNPLYFYLNNFNIAYVFYKKEEMKKSCDYLLESKKALVKIFQKGLHRHNRIEFKSKQNHFADKTNCSRGVL